MYKVFISLLQSLTLKRSLIRAFSLRRNAGKMPSLARLPVDNGSVLDNSVIPDDDRSLLPLDASVEVGAPGDVLVEKVEDGVRLFLLEADNAARNCEG